MQTASERAYDGRPAPSRRTTREDALLMAALRWFLFALLAFGGGAVGAFALHPPQLGIPDADAADLRSRLAKIEQYAGEGRCDAVKGQLSGATSTVDKLPENTAVTVQQQLQDAIEKVRTEAISKCLQVAAAKQTNSAQAQAQDTSPFGETTPSATPTPTATTAPAPVTETPAPDAGSGATTPSDGSGGGVSIPQGEVGDALRQGLDQARQKYHKERKKAEHALDQLSQGITG